MSISVNVGITAANGKKSTKAITEISPNATNAEIKDFTTALNDLSTNTITSINKIAKQDIDFNYTQLVLSTVSGSSNVTPTISGNTITYPITSCLAVQEQYTGDGDTVYFVYTEFNIKANSYNVTGAYPVVNEKKASVIYPTAVESGENVQVAFWIAGIESASDLEGEQFTITIPEGHIASAYWNTTTYTVKLV